MEPYGEVMPEDLDDGRSVDDALDEDDRLDEDKSDEEVVQEFAERRDLDDEDWIEDGEKYRCPECEAVHEGRAAECRVCGWDAE